MSIKLLTGDQIDCGSPVAIKTIPGEYELGFCCRARNITIDQYNSSVEWYAHCEGGYQSAWSLGNIMALMLIAYKQQLRIFFLRLGMFGIGGSLEILRSWRVLR